MKDRNHNICCHNVGKQNIQTCTSGSALRPSKSAARKEHLDKTATVSVTLFFNFNYRGVILF